MLNVLSASLTPVAVAGTCFRHSTSRSLLTCAPTNACFKPSSSLSAGSLKARRVCQIPSGLKKQVATQGPNRKAYRTAILTRAGWNDFEWSKVSVVSNTKAAEGLYSVVLDVGKELAAGYTKPGQFMQMRTKEDGKPAFIAISSPPDSSGSSNLEFLVKYVEGSTAADICALTSGGELEVSPVMGKGFDLSKLGDDTKSLLIFATGSGISPIRALIETGKESGGLQASGIPDIRLYYGAQSSDVMAFQDKFAGWGANGVRVVPVMSQEGDKKYVQNAFQDDVEPLAGDAETTGAVLCGQKEMAEAVTALLVEDMGVSKEAILMNF